MSGQQIGTVVGGVIGAYFGMPQLGAAIGGAIGGAISPDVIKAPSIGDAQKQASAAGVPRPVVYGHPAPFAGNIIDGEGKARKITVKQQQGKGGGPIVKSERFILTSAVRICEGPIAGVVRIWRNGEVVYDRRTAAQIGATYGAGAGTSAFTAEMRAKSAAFQKKVRVYLGSETQLPDPALEAIHGVGNTPYYRGTAYIVIQDDDVTDTRGAAAQYQFEVMAAGAASEASTAVALPDISPTDGFGVGGGIFANWVDSEEKIVSVAAITRHEFTATPNVDYGPARVRIKSLDGALLADSGWLSIGAYSVAAIDAWKSAVTRWRRWPVSGGYVDTFDAVQIAAYLAPLGGSIVGLTAIADINYAPGTTQVLVEIIRTSVVSTSGASVNNRRANLSSVPAGYTTTPELPGVLVGSDGLIYYPTWVTPPASKSLAGSAVTLRSVVENIAIRCNVPASKVNAIALNDVIPGFLVAQQFSGADTLRPTQQAFFYDLPEVDRQIKAIKRGGAVAVSITDDDLLETGQDDERVRGQAIEYPLKVSVVTQDPAAEYAPVPQTIGRSSPDFEGTSEVVIQLPIPFSAAIAAQIAHKSLKVMHSMSEGRVELALPESFSQYVASDAIDYRSKRWLIEEVRYSEGECHWKAVYDRASSYASTATGSTPRPPELPTSGLRGPTMLAAMNLPPLRQQDSVPGIYLAATGTFSSWDGCVVEMSSDGGASFTTLATITGRSVIGRLSAAIAASGEPIPVTLDDGHLYSSTLAALAQNANAFAIIAPGDVSEIGQFQTATEGLPGAYSLTVVTRGGNGTAAAAHASGERFVMLGSSVFVPMDSALAGKTLLLRAVTNGTIPENNPTISFVFNPVPVQIIIDGGHA